VEWGGWGGLREEVAGCGWAVGDEGEDLRDQALLHAGVLDGEESSALWNGVRV